LTLKAIKKSKKLKTKVFPSLHGEATVKHGNQDYVHKPTCYFAYNLQVRCFFGEIKIKNNLVVRRLN